MARKHDGIFERVMRTFDWLSPVLQKLHNQADSMVKLNMPPLMGRRDAAFDLAEELIQSDFFALDDLARENVYRKMAELLDIAVRDTRSILFTLSSPDTELREQWILGFLVMLRDISLTLGCVSNVGRNLFSSENPVLVELGGIDAEKNSENERAVSSAQIQISRRMRELAEAGKEKILRYRGYAGKSFSSYNANRYHSSYEEYRKLYSSPDWF